MWDEHESGVEVFPLIHSVSRGIGQETKVRLKVLRQRREQGIMENREICLTLIERGDQSGKGDMRSEIPGTDAFTFSRLLLFPLCAIHFWRFPFLLKKTQNAG